MGEVVIGKILSVGAAGVHRAQAVTIAKNLNQGCIASSWLAAEHDAPILGVCSLGDSSLLATASSNGLVSSFG